MATRGRREQPGIPPVPSLPDPHLALRGSYRIINGSVDQTESLSCFPLSRCLSVQWIPFVPSILQQMLNNHHRWSSASGRARASREKAWGGGALGAGGETAREAFEGWASQGPPAWPALSRAARLPVLRATAGLWGRGGRVQGSCSFPDSSFYRESTPVGFHKFFTDTRGSLVAHTVENLPAVQELFRYSALSDSLQPHRLQALLSLTISLSLLKLMSIESMMPSNHLILCLPFSSCPQSFPASRCFPMSQLFASGGQRIGASASDLPVNIQG